MSNTHGSGHRIEHMTTDEWLRVRTQDVAIEAMNGLLHGKTPEVVEHMAMQIAKAAYAMADAMISEEKRRRG